MDSASTGSLELLNKNSSAGCGLPPYELLTREEPFPPNNMDYYHIGPTQS